MKAYDKIPEWNELIFRELTPEEKEDYADSGWTFMVDNLPDYGGEVLVTDGMEVWIDTFDINDHIYLSTTYGELTSVTAWMPLPKPYKPE